MTHSYSQIRNKNATDCFLKFRQQITGSFIVILWTLFPGLIQKIIYKQFFTPKRKQLAQNQHAFLATGQAFDLKVNDDTIKCWQWGKGPALVCVHGWSGLGLQFQKFVDKTLAAGFSIILFDGPGHGLSSGDICSYFQMTDVVRVLINQPLITQIDKIKIAGLIGHSFGSAAIINSLEKERLNIPAVLIAPAIQLQKLIDSAFIQYGIPKEIYMTLIAQFEEKYDYSFSKDNPINLLDDDNQTFLIIHDRSDATIPYCESSNVVKKYPGFELMTTINLGHKKILTDDSVISTALNFITTRQTIKA